MLKGDKLLCKKDFGNIFKKNYFYTISSTLYFNYKYRGIYVYTNNGNVRFSFNPKHDYIWNYFYKPNELRKLKLERIKQCLK